MTTDARPDWTRRPAPEEQSPSYARYVARVPDGDVLDTMERAGAAMLGLVRGIPAELEHHRYAPGKWTVREVVGHCVDTERVLVYRALAFARGDANPLPGFEEADWARASNAGTRPLAELADEWDAVRRSSLLFFRGLDRAAVERQGLANGAGFTVRALAWTVPGHAAHHRAILEERYLRR